MNQAPEPRLRGLYAITPDWPDTPRLLAVTEAILQGGCQLLQYRNKTTTPCHREEQAGALRALTRRYGAILIINDDVKLALATQADGVHVGREDGEIASARARLNPGMLLGASCYGDLELARTATQAGADYIAFGSFFASPTKPQAVRASITLLDQAQTFGRPIAAIGGITRDNAGQLVSVGADMLAVISDLYLAADPERASREFTQLFNPPSVSAQTS